MPDLFPSNPGGKLSMQLMWKKLSHHLFEYMVQYTRGARDAAHLPDVQAQLVKITESPPSRWRYSRWFPARRRCWGRCGTLGVAAALEEPS